MQKICTVIPATICWFPCNVSDSEAAAMFSIRRAEACQTRSHFPRPLLQGEDHHGVFCSGVREHLRVKKGSLGKERAQGGEGGIATESVRQVFLPYLICK